MTAHIDSERSDTAKEGSDSGLDDRSSAEDSGRNEESPAEDSFVAGDPEPVNLALLGRLFGIPLIIVGLIVGGSVAVVFLFGAPATQKARSVESLLQTLESSGGEKMVGVLLPREKELWQTALELTNRLDKQEAMLSEEEVISIAQRLGAIVEADLEHFERISTFGDDAVAQRQIRSRRLEFAIHALGRTRRPESIKPLLRIVQGGREPYARVAMQELGNLHELADARQAIDPMIRILDATDVAETALTACTALSVIARSEDRVVIEALKSARLRHDGEVAWSAALALARLGSDAGLSTLLDLLDRSFWETGERYRTVDKSGKLMRYKMPPQRIDDLLVAALEAGANLENADLWEMIEKLKSDSSPMVRGRAAKAWAARVAD